MFNLGSCKCTPLKSWGPQDLSRVWEMLKVLWPPDCPSKQARDTFHSVSVEGTFLGKGKPHPDVGPQAKCRTDWQGFQFQAPQSCQHHSQSLTTWLVHKRGHILSPDRKTLPYSSEAVLKLLIPERFKSDRVKLVSLDCPTWTVLCSQHNKRHQTSLADLPAPRTRNITHSCHNWAQVTKLSATLGKSLLIFFTAEGRSAPPRFDLRQSDSVTLGDVCGMYLLFRHCCWSYIRALG